MLFSSLLRSWKTTLTHLPHDNIRCRHEKSPPTRFRPGVELLEDRTLLSAAVISGPSLATDRTDMPYTLRMIASEPATQWTINWGDGSSDMLAGNPSQATHAYTIGQVARNISATALINGQTVVATTSGAGAAQGAFGKLPGFAGMVFGPDITGDQYGDLYVTQYDDQTRADSLQAYDGKTGAFLRTLSTQGGYFLTVGPDNDLYYGGLTTFANNVVLRYDFATNSVSTFVAQGSSPLVEPTGVAFGHDADGDTWPDLYVASQGTGQILCYDGHTGQFLRTIANNLETPQGIAFGSDGRLYFTNSNGVDRYDFNLGTMSRFVSLGSGGLDTPRGLSFGPDGDLYVASKWNSQTLSYGSSRVLHYDGTTGAYISTISDWGRNDQGGTLIHPVVFGPDDNLYVGWYPNPVMPSGNYAPSCVECFAGPLTPTGSSVLPVTVLKSYQKTYINTRSLAIPDGSTTGTGSPGKTVTSTISVADTGMIVDVNIKFSTTHPNDSDLQAWLNGPNGSSAGLFNRIGGSGDNFTNTILDD